jgi:peptidyl-prolyl cis-trans isomerase A (cyclophilin A)
MTVNIRTKTFAAACAALILFGCSSPQPSKDAAEERKTPPTETAKAPTPPPPPAEPAAKAPEPAAKAPEPAAKAPEPAKKAEAPMSATAPETFKVKFTTSKGPVVVEVHKAWAPKGAQRFYELVRAGYFDGNRFFRIVPNFIVQFGMSGDPAMTKKWDKIITDDPVTQTNRTGSITFATAGPNTRTTQLFINLRSNQMLDGQGFAPFGMVVEGMNVVESFNKEYGERPDQESIRMHGNKYLNEQFPNLDFIKKAEVLPAG